MGGCRGKSLGPQLGAVWSWRFFWESTMVHLGSTQRLQSSSPAPEVLHFVWTTAARLCLSSPAFWLAWHAWEGHEYWLFRTEPGTLSAERIVYWGRGRTRSTKRARSRQRLWKRPETVFKGNKNLYHREKITHRDRIIISPLPSQSMAFVVKY